MLPIELLIDVGDLRIRYVRAGRGEPVVLLHGWPESWRSWRKNIGALSRSFDVIAPDLRGFGGSRRRDGTIDAATGPDLLARDLLGLLQALQVEQPVGIVSHDVGSNVAQAFARTHPGHVKKLFFFNCTYGGLGRRFGNPVHAQTVWYQYFHQKPWMEKLVGHSRETCRIYIDAMVRSWTHDPDCFDAADIDAFVDDLMDREGLRGGMAWYRGLFELRLKMMTQGPIQMPVISIPTRFLWGGLDPILPAEWTDALGDYFSRFRLSVVPDAGHFVHYEKPALANEEMLRFFLDAAATG